MVWLPAAAVADDDLGADEVTLKNGGLIRGTVISVQPGEEVVIKVVGEDEPRKVPWAEVEDVARGKHGDEDTADDDVQQPDEPKPKAGDDDDDDDGGQTSGEIRAQGPGIVNFRIETDNPSVELHELLGTSVAQARNVVVVVGHTQVICAAPCNRAVDGSRGQKFFFAGDGIPVSDPFTLSGRSGDVTASVDAGSTAMRTGGWAMVYGGIGVALLGGTFIILGSLTTTELDVDGNEIDGEPMMENGQLIGGLVVGGGVGLVAGGIALLFAGATDYELHDGGANSNRKHARAARWWLGEF